MVFSLPQAQRTNQVAARDLSVPTRLTTVKRPNFIPVKSRNDPKLAASLCKHPQLRVKPRLIASSDGQGRFPQSHKHFQCALLRCLESNTVIRSTMVNLPKRCLGVNFFILLNT